MTHDELLAKLLITDKTDVYETLRLWQASLYAVMELHYQDFGTPNEDVICDCCKVIYPCPTIVVIKKELI